MNSTYKYYEKHWQEYCQSTVDKAPTSEIDTFLSHIENPKELILELGSGSGNSLKYIHDKGFNVSGSDYIIDIVLSLKQRFKCCSYVIDITDVEFLNSFMTSTTVKHLFISAVLQHLSSSELIDFFKKIEVKGLLFLSLKEGVGEKTLEDGRYETYYTQRQIERLVSKRFEILSFNRSEDMLGCSFNWLSWTLKLKS
ncbi:MAG: class I SAM-dependent methyltransferase [Candidatus Zophobacter franzmannii]|nr:class I SAM-dependent methyltransferase [Candidatus Zophobacter franzmannii]